MPPLLFHLDANAVNARQNDPALNALEALAASGAVELEYSEIAYQEASYNSAVRANKAETCIWAGLTGNPAFESEWRSAIERAVFPSGVQSQPQRNDIEMLLTAKIAGAILVTTDGASRRQPRGILGSKRELAALGIEVLTPIEAVARVKTRT